MNAQSRANKRYIEKNREAVLKGQREYYQKNKEKAANYQRERNKIKREATYKWFNKIVTGYLPYEQGRKK